jgi:hypothetical protein
LPIDGRTFEVCGSYMVLKSYKVRSDPKCGNQYSPTNQKKAKPQVVAADTQEEEPS